MRCFIISLLLLVAAMPATADKIEAPVIQENGRCRFVLHHYQLSFADQAKINFVLADLLKKLETTFNFQASTELRIQIRIFGRQSEFLRYATAHTSEGKCFGTNLGGYYSGHDTEVVTWRQSDPGYMANNLLHECTHAILGSTFTAVPIWLNEGCAVYFQYPSYMRDKNDEDGILWRWTQIKHYLDEGSLPKLSNFLNIKADQFYVSPPERNYTLSWSLFQLLMSTPERRRAMLGMLYQFQQPTNRQTGCATFLNAHYPGGLVQMDKDWRQWIARGAANFLDSKPKS